MFALLYILMRTVCTCSQRYLLLWIPLLPICKLFINLHNFFIPFIHNIIFFRLKYRQLFQQLKRLFISRLMCIHQHKWTVVQWVWFKCLLLIMINFVLISVNGILRYPKLTKYIIGCYGHEFKCSLKFIIWLLYACGEFMRVICPIVLLIKILMLLFVYN